jgi:hypothetical protein
MKIFFLTSIVLLLLCQISCYKEPKGSEEDQHVILFMDTLGHYYQDPLSYPTSANFDIDADSIDDVLITSYSSVYSMGSGFYSWQTVTPLNDVAVGYMIGRDTTWVYCPQPGYWDTCWYYNIFNLVKPFNNFDTVHAMRRLSKELVYISDIHYRGSKPESGYQRLAYDSIGYLIIQTPKTTAWLKIEVVGRNYLVVHKCRYNLQPGFVIDD